MQKRMVRKLVLERTLAQIAPHPSPKAYLEQYTVPADVAAEILFMATYVYDDICNKKVIDLGCGSGRLAIGAALLGAKEVVGVDIDRAAIEQAVINAQTLSIASKIDWILADIDVVHGDFDTVLQNPPYGVQKRGADRRFLERALRIGNHVYSLHKGVQTGKEQKVVPSPFLSRLIEENHGKIMAVYNLLMIIPHMFGFHQKRSYQFPVNLYIIERRNKRFIEHQKGKVTS